MIFWLRTPSGEFVRLNKDGLATRLHRLGFSTKADKGLMSEVNEIISDIQVERYVRWAGSLAGWDAGRYEINGKAILVTDSPRIIQANAEYSNSTVYDYFQRLLCDDQKIHFHAWIKLARKHPLLAKSFRRGPAVIIVGKADHGKSLGGNLISLMLGGRQADPTQFAQGETTFNAHLFGAELLFADDKGGHDDQRARLRTASVIKQLVADRTPECHGKHKTPIGLTPFWRVRDAFNDEPEDLLVLPALSDGIMGKLLIFRTVERAIDAPTGHRRTIPSVRAEADRGDPRLPRVAGGVGDPGGIPARTLRPAGLPQPRGP